MDYEKDILNEQLNVKRLREQLEKISIPRRSINFQFRNMRFNRRAAEQSILKQKLLRRRTQSQIASSNEKILSLREALRESLSL